MGSLYFRVPTNTVIHTLCYAKIKILIGSAVNTEFFQLDAWFIAIALIVIVLLAMEQIQTGWQKERKFEEANLLLRCKTPSLSLLSSLSIFLI